MVDRTEEIGAAVLAFEAERNRVLRNLGRNDPLVGAPLRYQPGRDPNEVVMIEPGTWEVEGWAHADTGLPPACPVTPLGKDGQICHFLDTMGSVFELEARSSGKGPIGALFGGRSRYLEWAWPRWSQPKKDKPSKIIGWDADNARQCLVDACAFVGVYDPAVIVRGRGAWRGTAGDLIYHAGDCVLLKGRWLAPGEHDAFIYPSRPRIGRPSLRYPTAGTGSPGDELFEVLKSFNFDRPDLDPRLVLGWLMTAKIGGALVRRPVLFIHGGEGSGKSTLLNLLRQVMNGAMIATAETTQAGIYHHVKQDSVAILIDELEARDDSRAVDKILALARIAYSGDKMHRGGKDGVGKEFALQSSFAASAVNKPATEAQDDSRMAVVMLRERAAASAKFEVSDQTIDAIGRHLLKRLVDWWPRWDELVRVMRGALVEARHNDRSADTFAPLAAGCHVALRDDMPEAGELVDWQRWLDPKMLEEIANRERTWQRCLHQLLNAAPDVWRQNSDKTLHAVLQDIAVSRSFIKTAQERLSQLGMALSWANGEEEGDYASARLFIPTTSPGLHQLFEGTAWAGRPGAPGGWNSALRQAPLHLWEGNATCGRGLITKSRGIFVYVAKALEE